MAKKPAVTLPPAFTAHTNTRIRREVEAAFGDGRVEALLTSKMNAKQIPAIERLAKDAILAYATGVRDTLLEGFEPMEGTSFSVKVGTPSGGATMTAGTGKSGSWPRLTEKTMIRKLTKGYRQRVWAHRNNEQHRIVMALTPALHRLGHSKVKMVKVWPKGKVEKIGGSTRITVQYALSFPVAGGIDDAVLAKLVLGNFLAARWKPLKKSDNPSGFFRGGRAAPPHPGSVLYVEAKRPWIGPTAAFAGDLFRARLKNQLKP
jgi:hypothetical protein